MSDQELNEVASPCVSICVLNEDDICVGCYRTGEEVTRWWGMSNEEKELTIEKSKEREKKSYI